MEKRIQTLFIAFTISFFNLSMDAQEIPLPEHPRPDFQRKNWMNLNGPWEFAFDNLNVGETEKWFEDPTFNQVITVPFSWGSKLSGIEDLTDIGWYHRQLNIPEQWEGERVFLVIGACDWRTSIWIDGNFVGMHQGGYNQFEFDLTDHVVPGETYQLVIRVDDTPHSFKLDGKQGYGEAKGIWQTVFLEARGEIAFSTVRFTPDIDKGTVLVRATLDSPAPDNLFMNITFPNQEIYGIIAAPVIPKKQQQVEFELEIPNQRLWELDDPYLYEVSIQLHNNETVFDELSSYFGMRKISVMELPGTSYPYVAINNKPVYLQLCLDQAYHPDGFYTYPTDEFMKDEIIRSKKIGLNGNRIHIKAEVPRKLYWADKLGLLIMADVPNFWGEPNDTARQEWEYAMREMIARDYNHPSIFSWVLFNETWGLFTGTGEARGYLPETQEWVQKMFLEAKKLDHTRLIEDNSPCNYDHVMTDLNTWHSYLPGYEWEDFMNNVDRQTYPGSEWNFTGGNKQTKVPMLNSECGNVWGYEGSAGDVDWSWDYHIMMNEFRKHPKMSGWLYTEHHDVINEWNGYYRFDRSEKITGISDFIPDMDLSDLHSEVYLSTGSELCRNGQPGTQVEVPLYLSVITDNVPPDHYILDYELSGRDNLGKFRHQFLRSIKIESSPYFNGALPPLSFELPDKPGLYDLKLRLRDENAFVYHLNFTSFLVEEPVSEDPVEANQSANISFSPASFADEKWSLRQWNVLDGLKVNGAGSGYFAYEVEVPSSIDLETVENITLVFEASAKKLHGKDKPEKTDLGGDYMRGKGTFDPSRNPNSYPMTDTYKDPSILRIRVNGKVLEEFFLEDDPADHRGILSWYSQKRDRKLREAGSYGYLCKVRIPVGLVKNAPQDKLNIRFEVDEALPGGLALYGKRFGRYPMDPTILFE